MATTVPDQAVSFPGTQGNLEFPNDRGWWKILHVSFSWLRQTGATVSVGGATRRSSSLAGFQILVPMPCTDLQMAAASERFFEKVVIDLPSVLIETRSCILTNVRMVEEDMFFTASCRLGAITARLPSSRRGPLELGQ